MKQRGDYNMVTVIFLNLLRSKYNIHQIKVNPGTINELLVQIKKIYPQIILEDFDNSVVFINSIRIIHPKMYDEVVGDGDEIVFTHFIGGG
ncbi:MAG: MoaD/ThiS family protein [Tenericutes bacterium]|nr:MoaD/ThiS family protein [Mycoplasmatota bacterium]